MQYKAVFLGKMGSGKTQLLQVAAHGNDFKENSPSSIGVDFCVRAIDSDDAVSLWDTAGNERYYSTNLAFYRGAHVGVFCIDLTDDSIDEQEIKRRVEDFRKQAPNVPIICVGTKSDSIRANLYALERFKSKELFDSFIITSAKNGENVETLFKLICQHCVAKPPFSWDETVKTLQERIEELPKEKKILINKQLDELSKVLFAKSYISDTKQMNKAKAIEDFANNCEIILEGKHPYILKTVLSVAAAAVILAVTALIGFTVGVACGCWTGPGAFFAGLLTGYTAAVAVASSSTALGALTGGITAYGLFKPSKEMRALNDFTADVSSWNASVIF